MFKGLVTTIEGLCRLSGQPSIFRSKLAEFDEEGRKCLVLNRPIGSKVPVYAALVSVGHNVVFRLVRVTAQQEIHHRQQQIVLIEDKEALKRALEIVLEGGIQMGSEGYVCPKVLFGEPTSSRPVSLIPPPRLPLLDVTKKSPPRRVKMFRLVRLSYR